MTAFDAVLQRTPASRHPARAHPGGPDRPTSQGPRPRRPAGAPARYRATGVAMSTTPHGQRAVRPATTVALALLAAAITVWLGLVAQFSETVRGTGDAGPAHIPDRLAVVRVEAGETVQQLAARVAPGAPVAQVVERIRELNGLDSVAPAAGQTLIAPVG
jgi:predicted Zn-dependent protease